MQKLIITALLKLVIVTSFSQTVLWENRPFQLIHTKHEIVDINGAKVLRLERDLASLPFDANNVESTVDLPTFAKLRARDIENGIIEVKMMSQVMQNSPYSQARGFIGIAFRVDSNEHFECIYLRPANGRVEDQLRRNRSVQYFAYPGYTFSRLRKDANGMYETYADIGLDEWIDVKIEFQGRKARLYINGQQHPSFVVNEMLGKTQKGSIGLWVDIGTIGYFKDLKITEL